MRHIPGGELDLIYRYDLDLTAVVVNEHDCHVEAIEDERFLPFGGHGIVNGSQDARIGTVWDFFEFGRQFNETYEGVFYVRGVRCDAWHRCEPRLKVHFEGCR